VREIAVDHGGRVEVESSGGETTFTIVLPAG
jgi:signal transduction histidine kinase